MIAIAKKLPERPTDELQQLFVELLPEIERHLRYGLRQLKGEALEDALAEATANCYVAYLRLCQRGRRDKAFPGTLARYAVRQFFAGRTVGSRLNVRDPLSRHAQRQKGIRVERLDVHHGQTRDWLEPLVDRRRAPIPDQVAMRIDVPNWLASLSNLKRTIAQELAVGCSTGEVAKKHRLSAGRISQIRRELFRSWNEFHEQATHVPAAA